MILFSLCDLKAPVDSTDYDLEVLDRLSDAIIEMKTFLVDSSRTTPPALSTPGDLLKILARIPTDALIDRVSGSFRRSTSSYSKLVSSEVKLHHGPAEYYPNTLIAYTRERISPTPGLENRPGLPRRQCPRPSLS